MPLPRNETNTGTTTLLTYRSDGTIGTNLLHLEKDALIIQRPVFSNRPGWRRLPQPQRSAPLNYSMSFQKRQSGTFSSYDLTTPSDGRPTTGSRNFGDNPSKCNTNGYLTGPSVSGLLNESSYKAKAKLFDQLKGGGANLANMLGERKQVASTVTSLLKTVAYTALDLRRGNIASAIRRMHGDPQTARRLRKKDIANQWLSLQYGWKPLLSDVYDLIQGLHHRESTGYVVFRASSSAMVTGKTQDSIHQNTLTGEHTGLRVERALTKYMVRVRPDMVFAEPAALGFTNPLTVLWEVTPWSFVVDWALPIGRYLEQLSATHGWTIIDGCVSQLYYCAETGGYSWAKVDSNINWTRVWGQSATGAAGSAMQFTRNAFTAFPIPDVPQFKNPFSTGHFLNSLALLSQAFGRGKVYTRGAY